MFIAVIESIISLDNTSFILIFDIKNDAQILNDLDRSFFHLKRNDGCD